MAHLSLYRKFRPKTFDEVVGQEHIVRILKNQIKNGNAGHCYLFAGTRGTGKTSIAKIFSRSINCLSPVDGSPCGECAACKISFSQNCLDIIELDAASNNGVDDIRMLIESTNFPPVELKYKVFIIDEVHMLSQSAFNALLKTLEEPPRYCIFILATTEIQKIPQTIISRSLLLDFRLLSLDALTEQLKGIFDEIGVKYTDDAVKLIASLGGGSDRDMLSVAEMCLAYCDGNVTYDSVLSLTGLTDPKAVICLLDKALSGEYGAMLDSLNAMFAAGKSVSALYKDITGYLSKIFFVKNSKAQNELPADVYALAKEVGQKYSNALLSRAISILAEAETQMRYATDPRIILEAKLARLSNTVTDLSPDKLVDKIKVLEEEIALLKQNGVRVSVSEAAVKDEPAVKSDFGKTVLELNVDNVTSVWGSFVKYLREAGKDRLHAFAKDVAGFSIRDNKPVVLVNDESDLGAFTKAENKELIDKHFCEYFGSGIKVEFLCERSKRETDAIIGQLQDDFGSFALNIQK